MLEVRAVWTIGSATGSPALAADVIKRWRRRGARRARATLAGYVITDA
jgi:hypothetical protein